MRTRWPTSLEKCDGRRHRRHDRRRCRRRDRRRRWHANEERTC